MPDGKRGQASCFLPTQVSNNLFAWGYSPINGDGFVWEVSRVNTTIFEAYLKDFSKHRPKEHKIVVIDNAGLHSTKNMEVPDNIYLLNIPPIFSRAKPLRTSLAVHQKQV